MPVVIFQKYTFIVHYFDIEADHPFPCKKIRAFIMTEVYVFTTDNVQNVHVLNVIPSLFVDASSCIPVSGKILLSAATEQTSLVIFLSVLQYVCLCNAGYKFT